MTKRNVSPFFYGQLPGIKDTRDWVGMWSVMRQSKGGETAHAEALVFPGEVVLGQINFLMHTVELTVWEKLAWGLLQILIKDKKINYLKSDVYYFNISINVVLQLIKCYDRIRRYTYIWQFNVYDKCSIFSLCSFL